MASRRDDTLWPEGAPSHPAVDAVYARRRPNASNDNVIMKESTEARRLGFVRARKTSWSRSLSTRGRSSIVISAGADFRSQPKQTKGKQKPGLPLHNKKTGNHGINFSKERAYFQEVDSFELVEESPSPKRFSTWVTGPPQQSIHAVQDLPSILERWLIAKKHPYSSHSSSTCSRMGHTPIRMQMESIQENSPTNFNENSSSSVSSITIGSLKCISDSKDISSVEGRSIPEEGEASDQDIVEAVGKLSLGINKSDSFAKLLVACGQEVPSMLLDALNQHSDAHGINKIGEGTYGEAFKAGQSVCKIVPIDGDVPANGAIQKRSEEILEEVLLCLTLNKLRGKGESSFIGNSCTNFIETKSVQVCRGVYDCSLISAWEEWDNKNGSENDHPKLFSEEQCYMVFGLADGGRDLESFVLLNMNEARSLLLQVASALAVGEVACEFEHRDLHWGNILIARDGGSTTEFILQGKEMKGNSFGITVSLIDFTLSRIKAGEVILFFDLSADPEIFEGPKGDKQSETYRGMKRVTKDMWEESHPKTNVLWLRYLVDILLLKKTYERTIADERILRSFRKSLSSYSSAKDALNDSFFSNMWIP